MSAESLYYDETLILRASLEDVDRYAFQYFEEQASLREDSLLYETLLKNLGLVYEREGVLHPTVACLLFFGRDPQRFLPYAYITAARIPGDSPEAAPSDVKHVEGRLPDVLEGAARFLYIHLPIPHRIEGFAP